MKKQDKRHKAPAEPPSEGMSIDAILAQLASMKDNAKASIGDVDPEGDEIWRQDIAACEAATAILSALQDEGIKDPEQVRDLIHDYNALALQYQHLRHTYEEGDRPQRLGSSKVFVCPACNRQIRQLYAAHCWSCGKRLGWGR